MSVQHHLSSNKKLLWSSINSSWRWETYPDFCHLTFHVSNTPFPPKKTWYHWLTEHVLILFRILAFEHVWILFRLLAIVNPNFPTSGFIFCNNSIFIDFHVLMISSRIQNSLEKPSPNCQITCLLQKSFRGIKNLDWLLVLTTFW